MATESKVASEDAKVDLLEDDDEFEEFEINEGNSLSLISRSIKPIFLWVSFLRPFIVLCLT